MLTTIILLAIALFCAGMMIFWDWRARIIPDVYLFPFLLCGLLLAHKLPWVTGGISESILAAACGYAIGAILNFAFKMIHAKKAESDKGGKKHQRKLLRSKLVSAHAAITPKKGDIVPNIALKSGELVPQELADSESSDMRDDPDAIGMGDIKLMAAGGIWLGITGLSIAVIIACLGGILWAKNKRQKFVPFAPFFFTGAIIAIVTMMLV